MSDNVDELERRGWDALSGPGGDAFYADLMVDDGLTVFPGLVLDKASSVRAISGARPWSSVQLRDLRVIERGNTAVVAYHATAERQGEGEPYQARMASVYVRIDGQWRLLLHQQTPDPRPSAGD